MGVLSLLLSLLLVEKVSAQEPGADARNPIIWADVPDPSVIQVGDGYYVTSTTMHMSPGVPVMRSHNLVDWEIVSYAYDALATHGRDSVSARALALTLHGEASPGNSADGYNLVP